MKKYTTRQLKELVKTGAAIDVTNNIVKYNGEFSQTKRRKTYKKRWVYKQKNRCLWRYGWQRSIWSLT